jgi:hypothetical protein
MTRLGLIPCLGAALALPGCIVNYDLGETAENTSDGSGEGTGGGTGNDPSATSGQPGTTDPSATGEVPGTTDPSATATDGETDTSTDTDTDTGGEPNCEVDPDYVRWGFDTTGSYPVGNIGASFLAILEGECTVGEITVEVPEVGDPTWDVPLQCSLQGQIDGNPDFAGELSLVIVMRGTVDYNEVTQGLGQEVRLKLVLDHWGMGWSGWAVLEDLDSGEQLLDLVEGEYADPYQSTWSEQVGAVFGGPWRSNLSVGVAEDECGTSVGECSGEPRAMRMGVGPDSPLLLHEGQEGQMSNQSGSLLYRASVITARDNPMPTCTDTPLGYYAFALWVMPQ